MKTTLTILFALLLSNAQSQIKITEPAEQGAVVYVDKNEGEGIKLQRTTGTEIGSNGGVGGFFVKLKFKKPTSTVQLKKADEMKFIFRFDKFKSGRTLKSLQLVKFRVEKKTREILNNPAKKIAPDMISIAASEPYGDNSIIVTVKGLEAGEYAFVTSEHKPVTNAYVKESMGGKKPFWAFTVVE